MPYNNTPLPPPDSYTGSVSLPISRIKKIVQVDDEIGACSGNATFALAVATEEFIYHLARMTHNVVKSERRRRGAQITYNDVANAVARIDNLEFLTDVVPKSISFSQYKRRLAEETKAKKASSLTSNGQTVLDSTGKPIKQQRPVANEDSQMADDMTQSNSHLGGRATSAQSPNNSQLHNGRPGSSRGQGYDAIRNELDSRPDNDIEMDER